MRRITSFLFSMKIERLEKKKILIAKIEADADYRVAVKLGIRPIFQDPVEDYLIAWLCNYCEIAPPWAERRIRQFIEKEIYRDVEDINIEWKVKDFYALIVLLGNIWKRTCGE